MNQKYNKMSVILFVKTHLVIQEKFSYRYNTFSILHIDKIKRKNKQGFDKKVNCASSIPK